MSKLSEKKKRTRYLVVAAIFGALLFTGVILWNAMSTPDTEVSTERVFRKEVVHYVTATGKIEPEIEVNLSPDVSGEIIELPVREGEAVHHGDLLFKIQPDMYIKQVEQAEARLNLARAQSLEARARHMKADDDFRKASLLYREELISQSDYLTAKTNAEAASASYASSLYTIRQNESLREQAQEQLEKTVIKSPIDGVIIALESKSGERVVGTGQFPGTEVMTIANLDSMQVEVEVNENDIVNVEYNDPVIVSVDAFTNRKFEGVVREISNSAITQGEGTQEEVTNFAVKIRVLNHDRLLKPGMSATADIETERVKDALVVPIQSVTLRKHTSGMDARDSTGEGAMTEGVFVVEDSKARFRPVGTGTTDNTHIVIHNGVEEGDLVISGSYSAISRDLEDNEQVRLKNGGR
ncbi:MULTISPECIES: efflux RND transporter periplasmic adaptor subunit [Prosthecochloris]|uniref:Efflux RND transporter periplasmic adaptor subunit n=1 Tax=Prosthecochloris vibrioformis TaxID=1098 RepID=A0A5C4S1L4_PROVB|nr:MULTISPECIES: efflux RND transporter periplasmic adaptor subunit [Prosthecochloris]ANT64510.1 Macrolide-specific efflux protein MacA precursor [Prosthecochloris sp. CIB 2401]TNJ37350.1 efflux RND transporter periplasmic adaptor subunit [Prosthecochloris vibrioformis]